MAVMPSKNKPALVGYYLGIASMVPHAAILSIPAIVLGILGMVVASKAGQGRGHAVTAIVLGLAALVYWGGVALGLWTSPIMHPYGADDVPA